jgi:glucose/arabinose dehydrogenase
VVPILHRRQATKLDEITSRWAPLAQFRARASPLRSGIELSEGRGIEVEVARALSIRPRTGSRRLARAASTLALAGICLGTVGSAGAAKGPPPPFLAPVSASAPATAATTTGGSFTDSIVFSGLTNPTTMRFAPDGKVFVAEKGGKIKFFSSLSATSPTTFADLSTSVDDYWDRGLLGLAIDPAWPAQPYVYALYTYDGAIGAPAPRWSDGCPSPPGPTTDGCVVSGRLSRLSANADYRAAVLGDGPIGYWRLGETSGTTAADETGTAPGTYVNAPALGVPGALTGNSNTAASFDGSSQYVDMTNSAPLNVSSAVSVEAWVKPTTMPGAGNSATIAMKASDPPYGYWLQLTDTDRAKFGLGIGGVNHPLSAGGVVAPGSWYHIVGTYDGSVQRLYVNGALVASQPLSGTVDAVAGDFRIGTTRASEFFNGAIDEVAVFNKALTPAQVQAHYEAGAQALTEKVLISDWCQQYPSHSIGDLVFGPDGALYASGGEGANFNLADYGQGGGSAGSPTPANPCGDPPAGVGGVESPPTAEGGSLRSQDLRTSGDPAGLDGAVLRLDPTTGAAMAGNPLGGNSDANAQRIVAYGLRNPFRFTFRPGTNELWIADVGSGTWEEINRDPSLSSVPDYGWPCYEGAPQATDFSSLNINICNGLYSTPGSVTPPYYAYNHSAQVVANDNCPVGGSSITAIAFNGGTAYGSKYQGALFFGDHTRQCIWAMLPGSNGLPDPQNIELVATGAPVVDMQVGPDGYLYWVDLDGGAVHRLLPTGVSAPPTAIAVATSPTSGPLPLTVSFDGSGSSGTGTLSYSWDLNGDGAYGDSTAQKPSYTYTSGGTYNVRLKVTDGNGNSAISQPIVVTPNNTPPTATINTPTTSTQWAVGDVINFSGSATDTEDGTVAPSGYTWTFILHHCWQYDPTNCHTHIVQSVSGVTNGSFTAPDHEYPVWLEVQLTVKDSGGLTDTKSVRLDPKTANVTFASSPSGLQLVVGSSSGTTPFTRTLVMNSTTAVSAASPQTLGSTSYNFSSWSDGGAQTHNLIVNGAATLTANFVAAAPKSAAPTAAVIDTGSAGGGSVSDLAANDNQFFTVNAAPNRIASWYGRFTNVPQTLSSLRVNYSGLDTAACSQTVSVYRWSDATWVQLDSRTVDTTEVSLSDLAPPGAPSAYVNSGGELRVQVRCRASAGNKTYATRADLLGISYLN